MKTIRFISLFVMLAGFFSAAHAAEHALIQGILITASNDRGKTDQRLAAYEPTLKSLLRFESYRFLGDDSTSLAVPASGQLSIGEGHELEVVTESADARSIRVLVRWTQHGRKLMNTGLVLHRGVPAVIGGPSTGRKGEAYAVILIGK